MTPSLDTVCRVGGVTHHLSLPYFSFVSTLSSVSTAKSTSEALSHLGWKQAIAKEMNALYSNGTWELVALPPGKSPIGCRGFIQ